MAKKQPANKTPLVSVILPTFNRAKTIVRAIESVLNQSVADFELIIVDDASRDGTREIIDGIDDQRLRYLAHPKQQGAAAARNTGIAAARGEYISFQDSDDVWLSTKLAEQLELINSGPEIEAVFSPYTRISPGQRQQIPAAVTAEMQGDILAAILGKSFIGTPTLLLKRAVLDRCGGFNPELKALEDWELSIRLAKLCRFACANKPLLNAYVTGGSVSENEEIMLQAMKQIVGLHQEEYDLYPGSEARIWTFIGNRKCLAGKMREGRNHFSQALRADYWCGAAWFGLFLAWTGENIYRTIVSVKRRLSARF